MFTVSPLRFSRSLPAALLGVALLCQPVFAADTPLGEGKKTIAMQAHQGYSHEHCLHLKAGQTLSFQFTTPNAVNFDVHHHGATTTYPVRQTVEKTLSKSLPIKDGGEYCFNWVNPADRAGEFPIELSYLLK